MFSDTDSFIYEIGEDFYEIMYKHKGISDLSNQPRDSKYYCNDNKKVPGKMKDKYGGKNYLWDYCIKIKNVFNAWCKK